MSRLLLVNSVCGIRSTGRICAQLAREYEAKGWEVKIAYGRESFVPEDCRRWAVRISGPLEVRMHALLVRLWGEQGFGVLRSTCATKKFLRWAEAWNPDVIWLHNLHGYYVNVPLLFRWIKSRPEMKVRWTLHDCWAFTGGCGYFTYSGCEQWKVRCIRCPSARDCRNGLFCRGELQSFAVKRATFCGVRDLTLVAPSRWLAALTRESFLKEYPVEVFHNEIDVSIFKPTASDIREQLGLVGKKVVLGVAAQWTFRKGLDDFLELRKRLDDSWAVVLVGLTDAQVKRLPGSIKGITRTNSATELARLYSMADVFFNPTREENYPTVNLEARACGCAIITYDTGGCAETVEGYDRAVVLSGERKNITGCVAALEDLSWR